ncbi:YqaJ viral recombinase family protein [Rhodococcoides fascians]|uniref:YqaJ viral recombinase family protein n=1 Tax=Rhodococcoides fascians TaxID=1828 RepID=UPI00068E65EB|nr:YqaJ viral recombinase family protein [Rhodococcus fascians]
MSALWQPGDPEDLGLDLDLLESLSGFRLDDNPLPGSDAWLQTISASKVAIIMGYAPKKWGTRHSLYHQIIGTTPREEPNAVQARGHDFEPLILKWYQRDNPDADVRPTRAWANKERLWQTATPDALAFLASRVRGVEAKTADDIRDWGEPGPGQRLPLYYLCQIQWQMDTIGYEETDLAAVGPFELFHTKPKVFRVHYVARTAAMLRERCLEFREDCEMRIEPKPDYTAPPDRKVLSYQNGEIVDDSVTVPDDVAIAYLQAKATEDNIENEGKAAAAELQKFMGDKRKAVWNGINIANRQSGGVGKPPKLVAAKGIKSQALDLIKVGQAKDVA